MDKIVNEDYLNSILPPREFADKDGHWVRYVSSAPGLAEDVQNLVKELDRRLQMSKARETGICPIRADLYAQCFNEIIRQITIDCAERGFLMIRLRNEFRSAIKAQQNLYESSIAYGMRKALLAEGKKNNLQHHIKELEDSCEKLALEAKQLEEQKSQVEQKNEADREASEKLHCKTIEEFEEKIRGYYADLEAMVSTTVERKD